MTPTVRDVRPEDLAFIYSTMLKGLYYGSEFFKEVHQDTWFANYSPLLDFLLKRKEGVEIRVVCSSDEPDVILGYAVVEGPCIHYVFTKTAMRNNGIAKVALGELSRYSQCSQLTKTGASLKRKYSLIYNPWLI